MEHRNLRLEYGDSGSLIYRRDARGVTIPDTAEQRDFILDYMH